MATFLMVDNAVSEVINFRPNLGQVIISPKVSRAIGWVDMMGIVPQVSGSLYGFVNAATTTLIMYDSNGNLLATRNNLTIGEIAPVQANETYYLGISASIVTAVDTTWATLQLYETPTVSESFEGGFFTNQPFINGITASTNVNGVLTYTFNAVPLTAGQTTGLNLGYTGIALKTGTITMTSSDTTVFPSVSDGFVPNVVFQFQFQALKTTVFTGTIVVSVAGAGVLGPVTTVPVGSLGWKFNTTNLGVKRARRILKSITPGLNESSKKNKSEDENTAEDDDFITADN